MKFNYIYTSSVILFDPFFQSFVEASEHFANIARAHDMDDIQIEFLDIITG